MLSELKSHFLLWKEKYKSLFIFLIITLFLRLFGNIGVLFLIPTYFIFDIILFFSSIINVFTINRTITGNEKLQSNIININIASFYNAFLIFSSFIILFLPVLNLSSIISIINNIAIPLYLYTAIIILFFQLCSALLTKQKIITFCLFIATTILLICSRFVINLYTHQIDNIGDFQMTYSRYLNDSNLSTFILFLMALIFFIEYYYTTINDQGGKS